MQSFVLERKIRGEGNQINVVVVVRKICSLHLKL